MNRLTNKDGLIKGNFNYQAVKEAVERLCCLEDILEAHKVKSFEELNEILNSTQTCEKVKAKKVAFRPYLEFRLIEFEIFNDLVEVFGGQKLKTQNHGYIGEETNLKTGKGQTLNVGDIVVVRCQKDEETIIEKTTIIVKNGDSYFPMGFKDAEKMSLKLAKKHTELKNNEIYAECIYVILKEE